MHDINDTNKNKTHIIILLHLVLFFKSADLTHFLQNPGGQQGQQMHRNANNPDNNDTTNMNTHIADKGIYPIAKGTKSGILFVVEYVPKASFIGFFFAPNIPFYDLKKLFK
jgi:hypothetical protein